MCDLMFVNCGPKCGLGQCKSHVNTDVYLFVRVHKTSRLAKVKVLRLVVPENPAVVDGERVSAACCLANDWLPFLQQHGSAGTRTARPTIPLGFGVSYAPSCSPRSPLKHAHARAQ